MEPLIDVNASPLQCTSLSPNAPIWQDILAQAMTGEILAAMNYASLSGFATIRRSSRRARTCQGERGHALLRRRRPQNWR